MKKLLGGGVACALALVGSAVFTHPGVAQTAELQAEIDPTAVEPGETTQLSSVDPCIDPADGEGAGRLDVLVHFPDGTTIDLDDFGGVDPDDEGHWSTWGALGSESPLGEYTFDATCLPSDADTPTLAYEQVSFTLEAAKDLVDGLEMTTSPGFANGLAPGTHVNVASTNPCPGHRTGRIAVWEVWTYDFEAEELGEPVDGGEAAVGTDGQWTASFTAPTADGGYGLFALCLRPNYENEHDWSVTGAYVGLGFFVGTPHEGEPGPLPELPGPTVEPGAPAAARPVTARPNATG